MHIEKLNAENDFDDFTIVEVWEKAIPYKHFELYKLDRFGSLMFFDDYGIKSENGWIISQKDNEKKDDENLNNPVNLEPLHWKNKNKLNS